MPLIPQQDIVVVNALGATPPVAVEQLKKKLEAYPPCKVVSIAMMSSVGAPGTDLVAVIETI